SSQSRRSSCGRVVRMRFANSVTYSACWLPHGPNFARVVERDRIRPVLGRQLISVIRVRSHPRTRSKSSSFRLTSLRDAGQHAIGVLPAAHSGQREECRIALSKQSWTFPPCFEKKVREGLANLDPHSLRPNELARLLDIASRTERIA